MTEAGPLVTTILVVDDAEGSTELFARALAEEFSADVVCCFRVDAVTPAYARETGADLALVDLSFPAQVPLNGADALLVLATGSPTTTLAVLTQADPSVHDLLRDVWEVLPVAGMIGKAGSLQRQLGLVRRLLRGEVPVLDADLAMFASDRASSMRSLELYGRLVAHAGHAKFWRALMASDAPPSYGDMARSTGLAVNSLRNYRTQIVPELRLYGLVDPSLREIHAFARRSRPFLSPHVERRLG